MICKVTLNFVAGPIGPLEATIDGPHQCNVETVITIGTRSISYPVYDITLFDLNGLLKDKLVTFPYHHSLKDFQEIVTVSESESDIVNGEFQGFVQGGEDYPMCIIDECDDENIKVITLRVFKPGTESKPTIKPHR